MPSLRKRPGSPFWVCCFSTPEGRPTQRSTKQTDRSNAWAACLELDRASKNARKGILTQVQAQKVVSDILAATGEKLEVTTTRQFLTEWVDGKFHTRASGTAVRYRQTVNSFLKHLGNRSDRPISNLTPRDIENFRNDQTAQGKSPATANLAVKTVRIPLNLARRQGLILSNPAEAVELLPMESNTRDVFTLDQIKRLLSVSDSEWRGLILIGAFSGLRLGDAAKLTARNLDLERRTLEFYPQKVNRSKKRRVLVVPVHPEIISYLQSVSVDWSNPASFIFPTLSTKRVSGAGGLSLTFRKIMKRAGIDAQLITATTRGKGRRFYGLGYHAFRHTFISLLANQGVQPEIRMRLSGHSSEVHQRYTHYELEALRRGVDSLPQIQSESKK